MDFLDLPKRKDSAEERVQSIWITPGWINFIRYNTSR
jgi:hypothetical protein